MLCMHDSMLHCILHVGILLVHICGSCIWHVGMLYMHVACWHAVHACWHIVHVCDLWFFLASARVAASLHWCSMQPGVAFFMKATPGCHKKKTNTIIVFSIFASCLQPLYVPISPFHIAPIKGRIKRVLFTTSWNRDGKLVTKSVHFCRYNLYIIYR